MKKKLLIGILAIVMCFTLTACGEKKEDNNKPSNNNNNTVTDNGNNNNTNESNLVLDGTKLGEMQLIGDNEETAIKGFIVTTDSSQHNYPELEELAKEGYKTSTSYSEYELNEWFTFALELNDGFSSVNVYVLKNDSSVDYEKMSAKDIDNLCEKQECTNLKNQVPKKDEYNAIDSMYLNPESYKEGLYNVFFTSKNKLYSVVQLKFIPETKADE